MNAECMVQYVQYVADRLLTDLGEEPHYHVANPFDWMALQGMEQKTNFFEQRVADYQKQGARVVAERHTFSVDETF